MDAGCDSFPAVSNLVAAFVDRTKGVQPPWRGRRPGIGHLGRRPITPVDPVHRDRADRHRGDPKFGPINGHKPNKQWHCGQWIHRSRRNGRCNRFWADRIGRCFRDGKRGHSRERWTHRPIDLAN